jgi:4-amino-4-deoxychorismate lyase
VRSRPPWSLSAAKTLSYAENLAALRWAQGQGADDLLWLTPDGHALEAPTASLVWLAGDTLCTVAPGRTGILAGTTAAHLLERAPELGLHAEERMITAADLAAADAAWFASSLRGLAEVRVLDETHRAGSPWTRRLLDLLGFEVL